MNIEQYQKLANVTRNTKLETLDELTNYTLGLVCESGEVGDELKKFIFHSHMLDRDKIKKELGDVMWYYINICTILDIEFEDILITNIDKLKERYPNGFDTSDSIGRKE